MVPKNAHTKPTRFKYLEQQSKLILHLAYIVQKQFGKITWFF